MNSCRRNKYFLRKPSPIWVLASSNPVRSSLPEDSKETRGQPMRSAFHFHLPMPLAKQKKKAQPSLISWFCILCFKKRKTNKQQNQKSLSTLYEPSLFRALKLSWQNPHPLLVINLLATYSIRTIIN